MPLINNISNCHLCFTCVFINMMLINNMLVFNNNKNGLSQIGEQSNSEPISEQTQNNTRPCETSTKTWSLYYIHIIIIRSLRLRIRERTRTNNVAFKDMNSTDDTLLLTFKNHRWRAVSGFCVRKHKHSHLILYLACDIYILLSHRRSKRVPTKKSQRSTCCALVLYYYAYIYLTI